MRGGRKIRGRLYRDHQRAGRRRPFRPGGRRARPQGLFRLPRRGRRRRSGASRPSRRWRRRSASSDHVVFTGYLSGQTLLAHISAFDIGVIPDPYNEANDVMSMNKVFEYCALGDSHRLLSAEGDKAAARRRRRLRADPRSRRARGGLPPSHAGRRPCAPAAPARPRSCRRRRSSGKTKQRNTSTLTSARWRCG